MEFVETGIDGLDAVLGGGIGREASVLVSGQPGTGKSILGIQYLYNGVQRCDEQGIYLSFEEDETDLRQAAESLGFEKWGSLVDQDAITVYDKQVLLREKDFSSTLDRILDDLQSSEYDRLVMDSLTMFELFFDTEAEKRQYLLEVSDILAQNGLTALLINEATGMFPAPDPELEHFLTDGSIHLFQTPTESGVNRYLWIAKMRRQDINNDIFPLEIGDGGIRIHDQAAGFSLMEEDGGPFFD